MKSNFSLAQALAPAKSARLAPGTYRSTVTHIGYADDYVAGTAIEIQYELTAADGSTFPYREIFYNTSGNPRTRDFFKYLDANGIPLDALEEFVGFHETLVIKKSTRGGLLTIERRIPYEELD